MGQLWDMYTEYVDGQTFEVSRAKIAKRIGISSQALGNWRFPLSGVPKKRNLVNFADLTGHPYPRVLDAALHDAGYLPESAARRGPELTEPDSDDLEP